MASTYPGTLDSFATNKADGTATATDHKNHHNDLADATNKIEAELGTNPSAAHSTVAAGINAIMGRWIPTLFAHVNLSQAPTGTYSGHNSVTEDELVTSATPTQAKTAFMYLDPADLAITGYTLKYRVLMFYSQNAVSIGGSVVLTGGLYPYIGAGTVAAYTATVGTVVTGSTAATAAGVPAASAEGRVISSTFTAPAANAYILAVAVSGATTAGFSKLGLRLDYSYA